MWALPPAQVGLKEDLAQGRHTAPHAQCCLAPSADTAPASTQLFSPGHWAATLPPSHDCGNTGFSRKQAQCRGNRMGKRPQQAEVALPPQARGFAAADLARAHS